MTKIKSFICVLVFSVIIISMTQITAAVEISVNPSYQTYRVVSGDTLWKISNKFSTTVSKIKTLNNLTSDMIYPNQLLNVGGSGIPTVNYRVDSGNNLWTLARKYGTDVDTIIKSNLMAVDIIMPGQILTIPINSTQIVMPYGIAMMKSRVNSSFGDIYTWENGRRLFTVGTKASLKDVYTGKSFNIKYYGGSNHADIVTLTLDDTNIMKSIYGSWGWTKKRPMILSFSKKGVNFKMAVSLIGMPHGSTDIYDNGMAGQCCMYFYNSVGHSNPVVDATSQNNILKANGQ